MSTRDPYEVVLADLRARRDNIDQLIRALESFRTQPKPAVSAMPPSQGGYLFGLSVVNASKVVLRQRGQPLCSADIAKGLMAGGHVMELSDVDGTISSVLDRVLQQADGIVRMRQGTWGLAEWPQEAQRTAPGKVVSIHSDGNQDVRDQPLSFRHDI